MTDPLRHPPASAATWAALLALAPLAGVARAQEMLDLGGHVRDLDGNPVAGARIEFAPLALRALARDRGRYQLAQARHRAKVSLPRTATDREGRWRVLLSPEQAALALGGTAELEMRVQAPGFACWHRAIGPDLLAAGAQDVRLEPSGPGLQLRLAAGTAPAIGFVLVERPFRVRGNTAVWRRELVPIDARGEVRFAEPPRVPGEIAAPRPTARAEGYAITVFAAGMEELTATLGTGAHELRLEPNEFSWRKVLADRAEPARPPVEATYVLLGEERTLSFTEAAVPLLGNEMPIRITTASGPVEIDSWDPDLPLFVARAARTANAERDTEAVREAAVTTGTITLEVVDGAQQPVFGAGAWLENEAVEAVGPDAQVFALTDARGAAVLRGIPLGAHHVLVRHPTAGEREAIVAVTAGAATHQVVLEPAAPEPEGPPPLAGTLLLDLAALQQDGAPLEVGMLTPARLLVRRPFDAIPRWLRLEGLVVGPTTFYLRRGNEPPLLFGGVLALERTAARTVGSPAPRRFTLHVRDSRGEPAKEARVSLGDAGLGDEPPFSARVLAAQPGAGPGEVTLELTLVGAAWLRVEAAGESQEVQIAESDRAPIQVQLQPCPPPPPDPGQPAPPVRKPGG